MNEYKTEHQGITHTGKPKAFGAKLVTLLLHTSYISTKVCNMPHWQAWYHNLHDQLQRDAGLMDCKLDHNDVHAGEEKNLTSTKNQTGHTTTARLSCWGPYLLFTVRQYVTSMPYTVIV
jgi:hypothetical protein